MGQLNMHEALGSIFFSPIIKEKVLRLGLIISL